MDTGVAVFLFFALSFAAILGITLGNKKAARIKQKLEYLERHPKEYYNYRMREYERNKLVGILFLIIFFPLGIIILIANTKPDPNSFKDWDRPSNNYSSSNNSNKSESNEQPVVLSERELAIIKQLRENNE